MVGNEFHECRFARTRLARNPKEAVPFLKPPKQVTRARLFMLITRFLEDPSKRLVMSLWYGSVPNRTTFEAQTSQDYMLLGHICLCHRELRHLALEGLNVGRFERLGQWLLACDCNACTQIMDISRNVVKPRGLLRVQALVFSVHGFKLALKDTVPVTKCRISFSNKQLKRPGSRTLSTRRFEASRLPEHDAAFAPGPQSHCFSRQSSRRA